MVLTSTWHRWLFAGMAYLAATGLNFILQPAVGGRLPLLPYFPALLLTGFFSGAATSAAVLVLSAATVATFWAGPMDQVPNVLLVAVFVVAGGAVAALSVWARGALHDAATGQERLKLALTVGRMAAWEWDVGNGEVTFAGGATNVFGASVRSADDVWQLVHPDDGAQARADFEKALHEQDSYTQVVRIRRADTGEVRWVETHGRVHRDETGNAVRVSGIAADITDRQRAAEGSQRAEERLHVALEAGGVSAWECDSELRYTWACNIQLGVSASDLVGRHIGETMKHEAYLAAMQRVHDTGEPSRIQIEIPYRGQLLHYMCFLRPERDRSGRVARIIGASVDVTELKEVQERLQLEIRRKDTFLATLAHELRNPMAPIRYAVAMLGDKATAAMREQGRAVIERQSAQIARLLDDLLDLSRISRNAVELQREVIDLSSVVEMSAAAAKPLCTQRGHQLFVALPPHPVNVFGDKTRIQQVLGNLLGNATKYTDPGGEIRISLDVEGAEAVVRVRDNGIGIPAESLPHVFEMFEQVNTPGRTSAGLGIGLAVVKQLVEMHGGHVFAHSNGLQHGSEFTVRLPLSKERPQAPTQSSDAVTVLTRPERILVVDDNEDAANSLAAVLREAGFSATVAYNGAEAIAAFDEVHPRVVLLDVSLPDLSGQEVAARLRSKNVRPQPLIVAITGWGQQKDRDSTAAAGFDMHLVKPLDASELQRLLSDALSRSNAA
jgi:signal transduction histidine kinase/CheY-like chemotaxis protein